MSAVSVSQGVSDALDLLKCAMVDGNPLACVQKAIPLLEDVLLAVGPVAATSLDPKDRAAADAAALAREDAKFPKKA